TYDQVPNGFGTSQRGRLQCGQNPTKRTLAWPAIRQQRYQHIRVLAFRGDNDHLAAHGREEPSGLGEHGASAKSDERFISAKSRAGATRLNVAQNAHSSSSGASWPGLRIPNSRKRSCKLCRCKPIVAAVREIFQRCATSWRNR